jgi:hypothetical protein
VLEFAALPDAVLVGVVGMEEEDSVKKERFYSILIKGVR